MRFISIFIFFFFLASCSKKHDPNDYSQMFPPYKLIKLFSEKLHTEKELRLTCYGINGDLPKGYESKNGIHNFLVSYALEKEKNDEVSVEECRNLLVFVAENFLETINSDPVVIPGLDVHPLTSNLIEITISFEDNNRIELGQGVAYVYFSNGQIKYKGYNISEYREKYPAVGKHYTMHEESYEEALDIVKKQGNLTYLD